MVDGNDNFSDCTYNCFAEIVLQHVMRGEVEEVFVVEFALCVLFNAVSQSRQLHQAYASLQFKW